MKYINAEKLYKQVDEQMGHFAELEEETRPDDEDLSIFYQGKKKMCSELLGIINSLQQEKPHESFCEENCKGYKDTGGKCFFGFNCSAKKVHEQSKVDLEKETDEKWDEFVSSEGEREDFTNIARHFYELGRNTRKEE